MKHAHYLELFKSWQDALTTFLEEIHSMDQVTNDLVAAVTALSAAVTAAVTALSSTAHAPAAIEGQVNLIKAAVSQLTAATPAAPAPATTTPTA